MNYNVVAPETLKENCLKFFNNDELAVQVWMSKYALKNNNGDYVEFSPEERYRAIAKELARVDIDKYGFQEYTEDDYYYYLVNRIITPGGSGLAGIANPFSLTSLGNCFVISLEGEDSYGAILSADQKFIQIAKRRGGIGMDISDLRPSKTSVSNAAGTSTGGVSFIPRFSNSIREVAQEGRRGAGMISLSVNYPDIEKFIDLKLDTKQATGANLSVRVTDEFMNAVECEGQHVLRYPVDIPKIGTYENNKEIRRKISAKDLWNKMMRAAWQSAEPGILFWDKIISESPADCYKELKTLSTNPCQPGWAPLLTPNGLSTMDKISIGDKIWSSEGWTTVINKFATGIKPVYKYKTSSAVFYGTQQHKVVSNGIKTEVAYATYIDSLTGPSPNITQLDPQDIMDGIVLGDGSVHKASNDLVYLCIGKDDVSYFNSEIKHLITKHRPGLSEHAYEIYTSIEHSELPKTYLRRVPARFKTSVPKMLGFLRGLYTANGSVCGNRVTLKGASKELIVEVQTMLNSIGIASYITTNGSKNVLFSNGTYTCKESYDLNITTDRDKFKSLIGFIQQYKTDKIVSKITPPKKSGNTTLIKTIDFLGDQPVYDITVDNSTHTYWSGGCNVSNCGELPLSANDSCRLLSVNLTSFVKNPFTTQAQFDIVDYKKAAKVATIMMDNIIDLELEKIDAIIYKIKQDKESEATKAIELKLWQDIRTSCEQARRTGISAIGYGDMLAMLGMPYATDTSNIYCENLQYIFALECYRTSVELAETRGAFPLFNFELEKNNPFLSRLFSAEPLLYEKMSKIGRRNVAMLTIPPSGSLSILLRNQTSGIEPVFALVYKRKRKVPAGDPNITFTDVTGDCFQEYNVIHPGFKYWMELNGYEWQALTYDELVSLGKVSPYGGSSSAEIDPFKKIELQGRLQRFIDHSVSVTHNVPVNYTIEDVSKIYLAAWKSGCKGCTIYREGSRDGILTTTDNKPKSEFEYKDSPKRPRDLPCDIYYPTINGERYIVMVGLFDGKPFEVFALKNDNNLLHSVSKGYLHKQKSKCYNLLTESKELLIEDLGSKFEIPEWNAITRLLSWGLRHGGDITFAVEQLNEAEGVVTDVSKVLARTLKKYVKPSRKGDICPVCGLTMRNEGGCATCFSCGYSRCS